MAFTILLCLATLVTIVHPAPTTSAPSQSRSTNLSDQSLLVVTATTGNPPPVVTFHATQNLSLESITAKTTADGTTFYPFGWFWAPIGDALPPVPPTPPEVTPPEAHTTEHRDSCESSKTPTVTIIISYPTNSYGEHSTSSETRKPSDKETRCVAPETTVTTTAPYSDREVYIATETPDPGPEKREIVTVTPQVQKYLDDTFNSLGIGTADYAQPTNKAQGSCGDSTYDKAIPNAARFIKGLSPRFCKDWSAKPTESLSKQYSAKDVGNKRKRASHEEKRSPPPRPLTTDSYPGWTIDFDWKPSQVSDECKKQNYCTDALSAILSRCSGFSLTDAYFTGAIEDDCGTFTYLVHEKTFDLAEATCNLPTVNDEASNHIPQLYPQAAYRAAAHQFCYGGYNWVADPQNTKSWTATNYFWFDTEHIDDTTGLPAYCVGAAFGTAEQHSPASASKCKTNGKGLMRSDSKIWAQVVPSPSQEGCQPLSEYRLPGGTQCYQNFLNMITTCMPIGEGGKVGVWKESTSNGCWDWWLWGRVLT